MKNKPLLINAVYEAFILALARFHYLTAAQASRLLYPNLHDKNRYAQRKIKELADGGYVLRLGALAKPQYGQAPHVFTLSDRGRKYAQSLGASVQPYFRPVEEKTAAQNRPFMKHTLEAIDVLVAAERLCWDSDVSCPQMLTERQLKHAPLRVDVPPSPQGTSDGMRQVAVIPDGWFQLTLPGLLPFSIALELDRGTEDQKVWRQKIAAYVVWIEGPYAAAFETTNVTVAVVCLDEKRRSVLMDWTMRELRMRNQEPYAELFLFTSASPVDLPATRFFFGKLWRAASSDVLISLLDSPTPAQPQQEGVVYRSV